MNKKVVEPKNTQLKGAPSEYADRPPGVPQEVWKAYHADYVNGERMETSMEPGKQLRKYEDTLSVSDVMSNHSKAETSNPKDLFGSVKVSFTKLPAVAIAAGAHAMMDGAEKYGPYNWRDKKVIANIYIDAALRHLLTWFEGQEEAEDSGVHHLGHAIACCAILLDAQATGNLIDNRPVFQDKDKLDKVLKSISEKIKARKDLSKS